MPSYAQSGLKVNLPGGSVKLDGEQTVVLVDFDVSQSFGKEAGASDRWVMSPVLTATELQFTGSAKVTLTKDPALTLPSINGTPVTLDQFKATLTKSGGTPTELPLTPTTTGRSKRTSSSFRRVTTVSTSSRRRVSRRSPRRQPIRQP